MGRKPKGYQLSPLTINHIDYIGGLHDGGVITEDQAAELIADGIREMPAEVRRVLLPFNTSIYRTVREHRRKGVDKIAIYVEKEKRYVAVDEPAKADK